jgi:hypothetical protein
MVALEAEEEQDQLITLEDLAHKEVMEETVTLAE